MNLSVLHKIITIKKDTDIKELMSKGEKIYTKYGLFFLNNDVKIDQFGFAILIRWVYEIFMVAMQNDDGNFGTTHVFKVRWSVLFSFTEAKDNQKFNIGWRLYYCIQYPKALWV